MVFILTIIMFNLLRNISTCFAQKDQRELSREHGAPGALLSLLAKDTSSVNNINRDIIKQ